jgi:hypothetical protein
MCVWSAFCYPLQYLYRIARIWCTVALDSWLGRLREPDAATWISVSRAQRVGSDFPDRLYHEMYTTVPLMPDDFLDRMRLGDKYIRVTKMKGAPGAEFVHIAKIPRDVFIVRADGSPMPRSLAGLAPVASPFIMAEYLHPDLPAPILMSLADGWFVPGNELFSAAFVLRWLKYNIGRRAKFAFDSRYIVRLLDRDINDSILEYGQHARITADGGYDIVRN